MAIHIGTNFLYRGRQFLDERTGLAKSSVDLRNWNTLVPDGFEVYLEEDKEWYYYDSSRTNIDTGHFFKRLEKLYNQENQLKDLISSFYADKFEDLLIEKNWLKNNINYCRKGIIVSVIGGDKIGAYKLTGDNYTIEDSWVKLVDFNDRIKLTDLDTVSTDNNYYTARKTDKKFIRRDIPETIDHDWLFKKNQEILGSQIVNRDLTVRGGAVVRENSEFQKDVTIHGNLNVERDTTLNNTKILGETKMEGNLESNGKIIANNEITINKEAIFGDNGSKLTIDPETKDTELIVDKITTKTSNIGDLDEFIFDTVKVGIDNLIKNSKFTGEYDSKEVTEEIPFNNTTKMFSQPEKYWKGVGTWNIDADNDSMTGFSVSLVGNSEISQEIDPAGIIPDSWYVLSYKAKGDIIASINGKEFRTTTDAEGDFKYYEYKFVYEKTIEPAIIKFVGTGHICEPKLSKGTLGTSWFPSTKDTDPIAEHVNTYEYLKGAFKEYNEISNASGVFLRNMVQVGDMKNSTVNSVEGGISGIYDRGSDSVFVWSGSDFKGANLLISKLRNNPSYYPNEEELKSLGNVVISFGGNNFIHNLVSKGRFYGDFYGTFHEIKQDVQKSTKETEVYKEIPPTSNKIGYEKNYGFTGRIKVQGTGYSYPKNIINNEFWNIKNGRITGFSLNEDGSDIKSYDNGFSGEILVNSETHFNDPDSEMKPTTWIINNGLIIEVK